VIAEQMQVVDASTAIAEKLSALADAELATFVGLRRSQISDLNAEHADRIKPLTDEAAIGEQLLIARIREAGGVALPHPDLVIQLSIRTEIQRRIDVLRQLIDLVPADELKKALYREQPPAPEDMPWKAAARYLTPIAKRYGGRVAEIVAEGLVKVEVGTPKLLIAPRESALKNVSETAAVE
jgi:hypothetical protein